MKFQRSTFLIVLVATLLAAGVFVLEISQSNRQEQQNARQEAGDLFTFEEADVVALEIQRPDVTLAFRKRAEPSDSEPDWIMEQPSQEPASDGAVAYLLNLLATGNVTEEIEARGDRRSEFGFAQPIGIVTLTLAEGSSHVFVLGAPNFNQSGFYALVDTPPKAETLTIKLVSADLEPAVTRQVDEWKATAEAPPPADTDPTEDSTDKTTDSSPES